MDFSETLIAASQNERHKAAPSSYYRAKFDPPKKEQKQRSLSANIQKFLAKKEEEEKIKVQETKKKREELLAMRDPKATKKIQKMLKVIKSANKSVLADAIDTEHTAVTRDGPDQPDEDDYGYTSQEASALYQKMMEKYSKAPVEEKFPSSSKSGARDLNKARDRVREALLRQQEEEEGPHRRTRKPKEGSLNQPERESFPVRGEEEKKEERPKFRRPQPPPLDFNELLKIAAEKKSQPLPIDLVKKPEKELEPERLMTKKQKREFEEEQARREARQRRIQEKESGRKDLKADRSKPQNATNQHIKPAQPVFNRIPKLSDREKNVNTYKTSSNDDIRRVREPKDDYTPTKTTHAKPKEGTPKLSVAKSKHGSDTSEHRKTESKYSNAERVPNGKNSYKEKTGYEEPQRSKLESYLKQKRLEDTQDLFGDRSSGKHLSRSSSNNSITSKDGRNIMKPKQSDHLHSDKRKETSSSQSASQVKSSSMRQSLPPTSKTDNGKWRQPEGKSVSKLQPASENRQRPMTSTDNRPRPPISENRPRPPVSENRPRPPVSENRSRPSTLADNKSRPSPGSANKSRPLPVSENKPRPVSASENRLKPISMSEIKSRPLPAAQNKSRPLPVNDSKSISLPHEDPKKMNIKSRPFPPPDVRGTNGVSKVRPPQEGNSSVVRQFPPPDMRPARKFPPPDMRQRNKSHAPKRRRDSDSEYDSEMDNFIDDGPEDGQDVSSYIMDIFGYDKNKYRDFDDDDRNMESNFAQVMKEEYISKKIGLLEDLEDMRLEAEEKKKKAKKRRRVDDED